MFKFLLFEDAELRRDLLAVKTRFGVLVVEVKESCSEKHFKDFLFFLHFLFDFEETRSFFYSFPLFLRYFQARIGILMQNTNQVVDFAKGYFEDGKWDNSFELLGDWLGTSKG